MTVSQVVNGGLLLGESLVCMVAALCFFLGKNYERRKRRWMIGMQLSTALLLFSDASSYFFRGAPGAAGYWMVRLSNFLVFLLSDATLLFFNRYVGSCLFSEEEFRQLKRTRLAEAGCCVGMLLVAVSQFTNLYYYFDAGNIYHRAAAYPLSMLFPAVTMLLDATLLLEYRKRISPKFFAAACSYILLPMAALIVQSVVYGPALINLSAGLAMTVMFVVTIREQNDDLCQMKMQQAQLTEKLEIATMLNRCVKKLSEGSDMDSALCSLMEVVRDYFQADRSYLFEIEPQGDMLVNTYEAVAESVIPQIDNLQEVPVAVISRWMEQFRKEQVYYMDDLEQEKGYETYKMLEEQKVWRLLAVPLHREKRIIGFLGLDNPRQHAQDPTLLSSIQFFITNSLEQRDQQKYLKRLSYFDMLTHLRNRNAYMEDLAGWKDKKLELVGVAYIDLNGLKKTNDTLGHEAGDALIRRMASVLEEVFPQQAYRIGGDEFVVVMQNVQRDAFERRVQQCREKLYSRSVSAAMGAVWQAAPENVEKLLRKADDCMYHEKKKMKQARKDTAGQRL